jgi:hypothetical protein
MEVGPAVGALLNSVLPTQHRQQPNGHLHVTIRTNTVTHQSDPFLTPRSETIVMLEDLGWDLLPQIFRLGCFGDNTDPGFQLLEQKKAFEDLLHV